MIKTIYARAWAVLSKKPMRLWGISLLASFLGTLVSVLFGVIPGVALGLNYLLSTAMTMIFLHGYRGEEVECLQLFDCFKDFSTAKRVVCGMGWTSLWTLLWSLIPIVGPIFAIIRNYEYSLVPYILVTEPEISATEAKKESSKRTNGYKGKMFGAEVLLYVICGGVNLVLGLLSSIRGVGGLFGFIMVVFNILFWLFSSLFLGLVKAAFYEEIKNPTIPVMVIGGGAAGGSPKFCPSCGTALSGDVAFCPNCGAKLN